MNNNNLVNIIDEFKDVIPILPMAKNEIDFTTVRATTGTSTLLLPKQLNFDVVLVRYWTRIKILRNPICVVIIVKGEYLWRFTSTRSLSFQHALYLSHPISDPNNYDT